MQESRRISVAAAVTSINFALHVEGFTGNGGNFEWAAHMHFPQSPQGQIPGPIAVDPLASWQTQLVPSVSLLSTSPATNNLQSNHSLALPAHTSPHSSGFSDPGNGTRLINMTCIRSGLILRSAVPSPES